MRSLAHIETIQNVRPIEGCDNICQCNVLGWNLIIKKDEFNEGDKCIYIEIDSIVDKNNPNFAFLEKRNYKIKTMKLRGTISQGIALPLTILPKGNYNVGGDVTEILKVKKVEDEVPKQSPDSKLSAAKSKYKNLFKNKLFKWLMKFSWFRKLALKVLAPTKKPKQFPDWIARTDEMRLQHIPFVLDDYKNKPMVVSEKLDGTSTTFGLKRIKKNKFDFAICSRNVRQKDARQKCFYDDNVYHEIAKMYDVHNVLLKLQKKYGADIVVLQGETIGESIQKNKYGIKGRDFYAFNLIVNDKKIDSVDARNILKEYDIKFVPILETEFKLLPTVEEMISFADGKSVLKDTLREGLVIRDHDNTVSFKIISNKFLLKHDL